jgi:hypothetical protein
MHVIGKHAALVNLEFAGQTGTNRNLAAKGVLAQTAALRCAALRVPEGFPIENILILRTETSDRSGDLRP